MLKSFIAAGLLLVGCSGAESAEPSPPPPPPPSTCARTDRTGTYQQFFDTLDGNCGRIPSQLVNFDAPQPGTGAGDGGAPPCIVSFERWSESDCKLERTVSCREPKGTSELVGVTRQQTQDGSWITGTFTVSVQPSDGTPPCRGTYRTQYFRQ